MLKGKCVVVGISGGIAVYKMATVVSSLVKLGATVHVIMTKAATEFVSGLTFETLSKNRVVSDMFASPVHWEVEHISLAEKADLFLLAPATANIIGKIANGIADDMLTTVIMATKAKKVIAPAMNNNMYLNPLVQENIEKLKKYNYSFVEPDEGMLACGSVGRGRLAEPEVILQSVINEIAFKKDLQGINVLVSAGATQEAIDPVRFITNHSSGKMGYSIARAAFLRGANVTLVTGKTALNDIKGIDTIKITSADEMYNEIVSRFDSFDIIIKSAAVSDYKPSSIAEHKIKKQNENMTIELVKNKDILLELGKRKNSDQVLVGFCMETRDLLDNARNKLEKKNCDLMVANNLFDDNAGFGYDTNTVNLLSKTHQKALPNMPKDELAHIILEEAFSIYNSKK